MRILHILDHSVPLHSGYTFRTLAIVAEQRALGMDTHHITSPKQGFTREDVEVVDGLEFYRTVAGVGAFWRAPVVRQFDVVRRLSVRLDQVVRTLKPDILHAHSPALNGLAALRVAKRYRLPVVYEMRASWEDAAVNHQTTTEGSIRYRLSRALETHVLRRAHGVTTIAEGLQHDIISRGIPVKRITLIPNAVDISRFKLRPATREFGAMGGFVGSFYGYEGLDLLIEACPRILKALPHFKLQLVGGGVQDENLKNAVRRLGLEDCVEFTGRVPHDEIEAYYDGIDVFMYPRHSMRLTELVTPLKPLEAMATGGLVVASDVGGHRELITHGETGLLFTPGNADALAGAVVRLAKDGDLRERLRTQGRRFVEEQRSWRHVVARYQQVYEDAVAVASHG